MNPYHITIYKDENGIFRAKGWYWDLQRVEIDLQANSYKALLNKLVKETTYG